MEFMNYVGVIISVYCDNICVFCQDENYTFNAEQIRKNILEMYKNLLNHYETSDVRNLTISGADPLNYIGLPEFVSLAKQLGFGNIRIETNGNELSNLEFAKNLKEAGAERLLIPVYGSTPEMHDKVTKNHGSFKKLVEGIKNAVKLDYNISFHTSVFTNNADHMKQIYEFLTQLIGRAHVLQIRTICILDTSSEALLPMYIPLKDLGPSLNLLLDTGNFEIADIPYCTVGRYHEKILSTSPPDAGNQQTKFKSSVRNLPSYRVKIYPPICDNCSLRDKCSGYYKNDYDQFGSGNCKSL